LEGAISGEYGRCDRTSQLSVSNVSLTGFATVAEHYHARKSLCHVFSRNLAIFASMIGSIASIVVDSIPY